MNNFAQYIVYLRKKLEHWHKKCKDFKENLTFKLKFLELRNIIIANGKNYPFNKNHF